ncbi:MAG: zinc ribbon domain-containing protein [Terriglobia bacterium]
MPIYEYRCRQCAGEFELLVLPAWPEPACPACQSPDLEQLISGFSVSSDGIRQTHLDKARTKYRASRQVADEKVAAIEYEKKEREEHGGS